MAKAGRWSVNGKCRWCQQPIAWRQRADGSYQRPYDAAVDPATGRVVYELGKDGKMRARPTQTEHSCPGSDAEAGRGTAGGHAESETTAAGSETTTTAAGTGTATAAVLSQEDREAIAASIRAEVITALERAGIKRGTRITVQRTDGAVLGQTDAPAHPMLARVVALMADREPLYIAGPPGSGKTYGATQAASLIGWPSYVQPCGGISVGRLLGFQTATGEETKTPFATAFEHGGVLILDEFDRLPPHVGVALNAALENRVYTVGGKVVKAHNDFVVVATGNTDLRGATEEITAAQCIDLSVIARFAFVEWEYSEELETQVCRGAATDKDGKIVVDFQPLLEWIRPLRAALVADNVTKVLAGPRESYRIVRDLRRGATLRQAVDSYIWRGYPREACQTWERRFPLPKFAKA